MARGEPIVEVAPVLGCHISGVDAESLDGVDRLVHTLDLWPAIGAEQELATGTQKRQSLIGLARRDRSYDVHAGDDRAVVIRHPSNEAEDAA